MRINTLYSIQYLRATAIIFVVIYHAYIYSSQYTQSIALPIPHEFGMLGVLLFFTISGFIMSYLLDKNESFFFLRRLARIYPTYFLIVMVIIFIKVIIFGSIENPKLMYAMTLLPWSNIQTLAYPLGVEWSLVYEVFFYLVCSTMAFKFFNTVKKIFLMLLWLCAIIFYNLYYHEISPMRPLYHEIFLSIFNLSFIFGFLTYYIYKKIFFCKTMNIKLIYIILFTIGFFLFEVYLFRIFQIGIIKILVISLINGGAMILLLMSDNTFKAVNTLLQVGNKSYGIYLTHVPIITILLSIFHNFFQLQITTILFLSVIVISFYGGYLFGKLDEIVHFFLKKKIDLITKNQRA